VFPDAVAAAQEVDISEGLEPRCFKCIEMGGGWGNV